MSSDRVESQWSESETHTDSSEEASSEYSPA